MPAFLQEGLTIHFLVEIPFLLVALIFNCISLAYDVYHFKHSTFLTESYRKAIVMSVLLLLGYIARLALTVYYCVSRSKKERNHYTMSQVQPLVFTTLITLVSLTVWILAFGLGNLFTSMDFGLLIMWIITMVASLVACILAGLQWGWMKNGDSRATKSFHTTDTISLGSLDDTKA